MASVAVGGVIGVGGGYAARASNDGWQTVNVVTDFGADPRGSVSAASHFHDAFAHATSSENSIVFTPPGIYRFDTQIVVPSRLRWHLDPEAILVKNFGGKPGDRRNNSLIRNENAPLNALLTADPGGWEPSIYDDDITIRGGRIRHADSTKVGGGVYMLGVRRLYLEGVVVEHSRRDWAFAIGGDDIVLERLRVEDNQEVFEDAIHLMQGHRIQVIDPWLVSGDDAIAFGTNYNLELSDVDVRGGIIKSRKGNALSFYQNRDGITEGHTPPTRKVSRIRVSGVAAQSGLYRNGIINASYGIQYVTGKVVKAGDESLVLSMQSSDKDDFYAGCKITITAGAGAGRSSFITSYDGGTKTAAVMPPILPPPDGSSHYSISGALVEDVEVSDCTFEGGQMASHDGKNQHGARFVNLKNLLLRKVEVVNSIEDPFYFEDIRGELRLEQVINTNAQKFSSSVFGLQAISCDSVKLEGGSYTRSGNHIMNIVDSTVSVKGTLLRGIDNDVAGLRTDNTSNQHTELDVADATFSRAAGVTSSRPLQNDGKSVSYRLVNCNFEKCDLMALDNESPLIGSILNPVLPSR